MTHHNQTKKLTTWFLTRKHNAPGVRQHGPALHMHAPDPIGRGTFRCSPRRTVCLRWEWDGVSSRLPLVLELWLLLTDRDRRDGGTLRCMTTTVESTGKAYFWKHNMGLSPSCCRKYQKFEEEWRRKSHRPGDQHSFNGRFMYGWTQSL
jgi:hypothetical protein